MIAFAATATAQSPFGEKVCKTLHQQMDAIQAALVEDHGRACYADSEIYPLGEPECSPTCGPSTPGAAREPRGPFEIFCYPQGQAFEGILTVSESCEVSGDWHCKPHVEN